MPSFPVIVPSEEVAGVELDARFGGGDLQDPSGLGVVDLCGRRHDLPAIQHEVMIVADRVGLDLVDPRSDRRGLGEIERSAGNRGDLASGNEGIINGRVMVGGQHQLVSQHRLAGPSAQVEVTVVGKVDRRGLIGGCRVLELQLVLLGDREQDADVEVSGIALLTVSAVVAQLDRRTVRRSTGSAFQITLSNPLRPPCRLLGPLLTASLCSCPLSVKVPLAMRLATLPTVAPK